MSADSRSVRHKSGVLEKRRVEVHCIQDLIPGLGDRFSFVAFAWELEDSMAHLEAL